MSRHDVETQLVDSKPTATPLSGTREKETYQQSDSVTRNIYIEKGSKFALRFTVYHRLSLLVILPNAAIIIYLVVKGHVVERPEACLNAVAANITVTVLILQDHIINILFTSFGLIPHWIPLCIRKHAAKLYHLGGIHSGAAIASGIWFLLFNIAVLNAQHHIRIDAQNIASMSLCMLMDILLLQMLVFSYPTFRTKFHDIWEQMHRFSGWLLLISFWAFMVMYNIFQAQSTATPLAQLFYYNPAFYLLSVTSISIVLPWFALRKVQPRIDRLSSHAIRLHFDYTTVGPCRTPRFSTSPLTEWHSFASIPNFYSKGYSIIVSRAGDWTGQLIDNPPTTLWTRGFPACGVLYMAKMFRSILCVGTGSGLAPILGLLTMSGLKFRVLWSAADPARSFGHDVTRRILKADPRAVIWDTRDQGRPDLVKESFRLYTEADDIEADDIEAVFVISNPKVTSEVVFGLEKKGVPAFGPIFDS